VTQPGPLVVLIGPPGAGKSAVGPLLAGRLGVEFRDTDADVGAAAGKPVSDIFIENGEEAFRELERAAAARALDERGPLRTQGGVLALGSGAVLDAGTRSLLEGLPDRGGQGERGAGAPPARKLPSRGGLGGSSPPAMPSRGGLGGSSPPASTVVYLSADFSTVARRIGLDRPRVVVPGNPRGRLRAMLDERAAIYQRLAAVTVPTDDQDPDEIADQIAAEITMK
jgi:shikimate kinase